MEKVCALCGNTQNIQLHHVYGAANRKISDRMGFTEYLCLECHTGGNGVHMNNEKGLQLKQKHQRIWEETHDRESFLKLICRNYL